MNSGSDGLMVKRVFGLGDDDDAAASTRDNGGGYRNSSISSDDTATHSTLILTGSEIKSTARGGGLMKETSN